MTDVPCPAKPPDVNCIRNAWGELFLGLQRGIRKFDSIEVLRETLFYEDDNLDIG